MFLLSFLNLIHRAAVEVCWICYTQFQEWVVGRLGIVFDQHRANYSSYFRHPFDPQTGTTSVKETSIVCQRCQRCYLALFVRPLKASRRLLLEGSRLLLWSILLRSLSLTDRQNSWSCLTCLTTMVHWNLLLAVKSWRFSSSLQLLMIVASQETSSNVCQQLRTLSSSHWITCRTLLSRNMNRPLNRRTSERKLAYNPPSASTAEDISITRFPSHSYVLS